MRKNNVVRHPSRDAARAVHPSSSRASGCPDPADPDRYRHQLLAIWAVAEANRRRCAHRP